MVAPTEGDCHGSAGGAGLPGGPGGSDEPGGSGPSRACRDREL